MGRIARKECRLKSEQIGAGQPDLACFADINASLK
jgi:hypothetical protein